MLQQYETVFILTPVLSDAQMKETVTKFRDTILANEGEIVYEEDWGLKKLAYPIQKKNHRFLPFDRIQGKSRFHCQAGTPVSQG